MKNLYSENNSLVTRDEGTGGNGVNIAKNTIQYSRSFLCYW